MSDKPTGEWTREDVYNKTPEDIVVAHNAALAAEREKHATVTDIPLYASGTSIPSDTIVMPSISGYDDWAAQIERHSERDWSEHLRIQLAAEVEKVNKLQEQLAAERKKVQGEWTAERLIKISNNNPTLWPEVMARELNKLAQQLAAERKKLKEAKQH